jgi:hypothetical protein
VFYIKLPTAGSYILPQGLFYAVMFFIGAGKPVQEKISNPPRVLIPYEKYNIKKTKPCGLGFYHLVSFAT